MPFVQVHTASPVSAAIRNALGFLLAEAYGEHMQMNRKIVNVGFVHYAEGELVRYDGADDGPQEMTVVTCEVRAGRDAQMLEALGHAITDACSQQLGIAAARVAVYMSEHPAYQIYRDGGRAPDWSPEERLTTKADLAR